MEVTKEMVLGYLRKGLQPTWEEAAAMGFSEAVDQAKGSHAVLGWVENHGPDSVEVEE